MPSTISRLTREEFLQQLTTLPVQECAALEEDISCTICIKDPVDTIVHQDDEHAVLLHGRHVFGERCAREWLATANTCPKCRTKLFKGEDDDDSDAESDDGDDTPVGPAVHYPHITNMMLEIAAISRAITEDIILDDPAVMRLYLRLWNAWHIAIINDRNGTWTPDSVASLEVAEALHTLLVARWESWCCDSTQVDNSINQLFRHPEGTWTPSHRDLKTRVRIDFDCALRSDFRMRELTPGIFLQGTDADGVCKSVVAHPMAVVLFDGINEVLQRYSRRKIKISSLIEELRAKVADPREYECERRNEMPPGYAHFVRYLIDETCRRALDRHHERRRVQRARRARAARSCPQ